mmetsp:Transcript_28717/g.84692  ORF Transcript_28717/g.84692 Transcript_28717/m.84692 type:complete len:246 (+) Transcript_28717:611-1348(+)
MKASLSKCHGQPRMPQHHIDAQPLRRIGIQHGHNQIPALPAGIAREEPVRTQLIVLLLPPPQRRQRRLRRQSTSSTRRPRLVVPFLEGLIPGTTGQILSEGKGTEQHGVQYDPRAPHVGLGAVVPRPHDKLPPGLVPSVIPTGLLGPRLGLLPLPYNLGGDVVGTSHHRRHTPQRVHAPRVLGRVVSRRVEGGHTDTAQGDLIDRSAREVVKGGLTQVGDGEAAPSTTPTSGPALVGRVAPVGQR